MPSKTKVEWPKEWPITEARDIHKGNYSNGKGQCCLLGLSNRFVTGSPTHSPKASPTCTPGEVKLFDRVVDFLGKALSECLDGTTQESRCKTLKGDWWIPDANDSVLTKGQAARVWNRAGYLAGYTRDNPEKKSLPKFAKLKEAK